MSKPNKDFTYKDETKAIGEIVAMIERRHLASGVKLDDYDTMGLAAILRRVIRDSGGNLYNGLGVKVI